MRNAVKILLLFCALTFSLSAKGTDIPPPPRKIKYSNKAGKPFVIGTIHNQLGNQMFEVAATLSLALDNGAEAHFPDLYQDVWIYQGSRDYVFWRLNMCSPKTTPLTEYCYHEIPYKPIPYSPNMKLTGLFQSEKYFLHHKEKILRLFKPHHSIVNYIHKKHPWLKEHQKTVAVHVRAYHPIHPSGCPDGAGVLPFLGKSYFEEAIMMFPKDHLFVIFSDNIKWCKKHLSSIPRKLKFIEGQPHYIDLYMISFCKNQIISNSTFSWWGAYMNTNPNKMVIAPKTWFNPDLKLDSRDIIPEGWIKI